jgi:ElaB/YqjD/DUF883 family membrane-anchored ribosome-binding protein
MNRTSSDEESQHAREREGRGERPAAGSAEAGGDEIARLRAVGRNLATQLAEQVEKRPYVAIGAAAGAGFVVGSVFGSRLGQMLLAAAIGYAMKNVIEGNIGVEQIEERLEALTGERTQG